LGIKSAAGINIFVQSKYLQVIITAARSGPEAEYRPKSNYSLPSAKKWISLWIGVAFGRYHDDGM